MYSHEIWVRGGRTPNGNRYLFNKIKKIHQFGLSVIYKKVVESVDEKTALLVEMEEIKKVGRNHLCNLTDGGEGVSGLIHSVQTRQRLSEVNKLRFCDPEERRKTSELTKIGMRLSDYVDRVSKELTLQSPLGEIVTIKNISKFCRDQGLQNGNLYKVINGKIKSHRGWMLPPLVTSQNSATP